MEKIYSYLKCLFTLAVLFACQERSFSQNVPAVAGANQRVPAPDTTERELVPLPFGNMTTKRYQSTGSAFTITGEQLERYPTADLRNALKSLIPGLNVQEIHGAPGHTAEEEQGRYGIAEKVEITGRGLRVRYLIDDVPVDITEMMLDPREIETVTFIKDITQKAMFGPYAANGVVLIRTKRGREEGHKIRANLESGVNFVGRMPGFVPADTYAEMNNQARQNSGMAPLYTPADIEAYRNGNPYDLYHPNVNFKEMMFRNSRSFNRVNVSASGGNSTVRYFSYLGYTGEGDLYKLGGKADFNRLNVRSNLDIRINDRLKVDLNVVAGISLRRSPNFGYATSEGSGNTRLVEMDLALPMVNTVPALAFPVYAKQGSELTAPVYGVSQLFTYNPIGNLVSNGQYTETSRNAAAKLNVQYDLSGLAPGLRSETSLSFDLVNLIRMGSAEQYAAYTVRPFKTSTGADTVALAVYQNAINDPQRRNLHDYYYQRFMVYEKLDYAKTFGRHDVYASGTYLLFRVAKDGVLEPQRFQSGVFTGRYTFDKKYTVSGVLNLTGTYSFSKENRNGAFPSIGLGWVVTEENFFKNQRLFDYLKVRGEAGILGFESNYAPFHYRDRWTTSTGTAFGPGPTGRWFGSTTDASPYVTVPARIGNPNLTWEKRKEVNLGVEGTLLDGRLGFEINYYNNLRHGQITQLPNSQPFIVGVSTSLPRYNHNQTRYFGVESAWKFSGGKNDFSYTIGANFTLPGSKIIESGDPEYRNAYQFRKGNPVDAYWGHRYLGKFTSNSEASQVPQLYDQQLEAGDLKYADLNNDGVVDEQDMTAIGHLTPRLVYGIHADLKYRNFGLYILGGGCAFYDIPMTNSYFWNGWGDNNYSNFVRDNVGGAYPRLTYERVNNNFVASDFWLMNGNYFKIQNVELSYDFSDAQVTRIGLGGLMLFVRGANLLTISGVKDVDPESVNSGLTMYPLNKTLTAGLKLSF
ncbi:SusC/RagA family TonB-linked outer membrane protein [Ravibacter arvi]|uniref:SusC/RagA family TonB-linked outer membrane protein n=1 Tax=Ravibacter arvi TaxID=2051041 RepID=A0ABP8LVW3_9BACT